MRSIVSTGLALALVTSLGLAACNDGADEEDINAAPPPATDPLAPADPAAMPPAEDPATEPVTPQ